MKQTNEIKNVFKLNSTDIFNYYKLINQTIRFYLILLYLAFK